MNPSCQFNDKLFIFMSTSGDASCCHSGMDAESQLDPMRDFLISVGEAVCDVAQAMLRREDVEQRTRIRFHHDSDVIYAIDVEAEEVIVRMLEENAARFGGIVLVAEGIGKTGETVYPRGSSPEQAQWRVLLDPIDGTRGLMYDKRSAFFLAGAAPNRGIGTRLRDIEVSVMVEISTSRMHVSDVLSAVRGGGAQAYRRNLLDNSREPFRPQPSRHTTIRGGFAQISRFFPSGKELMARIEEELIARLFPDAPDGEVLTFEDQYIASGGQLYELLTGKDRFIADIRPAVFQQLHGSVRPTLTCHPYDLAAHLIGEECGLILTGLDGKPLDGPMDTLTPMGWVGYANREIHSEVGPVFMELLQIHGLA